MLLMKGDIPSTCYNNATRQNTPDTEAVSVQFLNKMGYPKHIPRAVIYAPMVVGGIGLHHLGSKQGVQQVIQLIKHLCANNSNGWIYRNLLMHTIYMRAYQTQFF